MSKEFYTVTQLAEKLPLSKLSIYKALHKGEIPSVRIGKRYIIPREKFDKKFGLGSAKED